MSDDALQSLLYVSTAEVPFTSVDLVNLTSRSEYANQKRDITGYLWFGGSMFLQYLEGPADAIDTLETGSPAIPGTRSSNASPALSPPMNVGSPAGACG